MFVFYFTKKIVFFQFFVFVLQTNFCFPKYFFFLQFFPKFFFLISPRKFFLFFNFCFIFHFLFVFFKKICFLFQKKEFVVLFQFFLFYVSNKFFVFLKYFFHFSIFQKLFFFQFFVFLKYVFIFQFFQKQKRVCSARVRVARACVREESCNFCGGDILSPDILRFKTKFFSFVFSFLFFKKI